VLPIAIHQLSRKDIPEMAVRKIARNTLQDVDDADEVVSRSLSLNSVAEERTNTNVCR